MKLVSAQSLGERLNLSDSLITSGTTQLESVLASATSLIEGVIRTQLESRDRLDYFSPNWPRLSSYSMKTISLSQKFVESGAISVYYTADGYPISSIATATKMTENTDYVVDYQNGFVKLLTEPTKGVNTVAVKYTAGFKDEGSNVPLWLQEAAITAATYVRHTQAVSHNRKDVKDLSPEIRKQLMGMLNEYVMSDMGTITPDRADVL